MKQDSTTEERTQVTVDTPERVGKVLLPLNISGLRHKLGQKAAQEPKFRFYALYDRIYRLDVLMAGWMLVRSKDGAGGVDGVTVQDIEASPAGARGLVAELHQELRAKTYRPQPLKRVYILKPNGDKRPLGIPSIRDRVVQAAARLILEPIFEADFKDCSHGFRPGRSQHKVLEQVQGRIESGYVEAIDADLQGYFDSIPHDKLMQCVELRISDRSVLTLIRLWLRTPVEEPDDQGIIRRKVPRQGTPQGGVISPLLSNIYLHWLDGAFDVENTRQKWGGKLVRYADDFVILFRRTPQEAVDWIYHRLEGQMHLVLNRQKTRQVDLRKDGDSFGFLGYDFEIAPVKAGYKLRKAQMKPMKKAVKAGRSNIREATSKSSSHLPIEEMVTIVNRKLVGWGQYFRVGNCRPARRALNWYTQQCFYRYLQRKSQRGFNIPEDHTIYGYLMSLGLKAL